MNQSNVDLRIWLWCASATALVAMAGASLGPAHIDPPMARQPLVGPSGPSEPGTTQLEHRVDGTQP